MITVSAFRWVPPFARGLVRDLRVRWALEEAGIPYRSRLIGFQDQSSPDYRERQPFGQVPAIEDDGLVLFESGSILLHIAEKSDVLLPREPHARARAVTWLFCALNTMETVIQDYAGLHVFYANEEWARLRKPSLEERLKLRLKQLAASLGDRPYLEGAFTAGDLMMATVLRIVGDTDVLAAEPALLAYMNRCIARPAFARALGAQLADFDPA